MPNAVASVEAIKRGLTRKFDASYKSQTVFYPALCTQVQSFGRDEKYGWLGALPSMREWIGDRQFDDIRQTGFELENKAFESSVMLDRFDIDDDRYGYFANIVAEMAEEAKGHPDTYLFEELINKAESLICYDGQYFFDTDHSWGESGTQSNKLTYNMAGSEPTVLEFKAAFNQAVLAMMQFKNDKGRFFMRPRANQLDNLMLCVPTALLPVANEAFNQQFMSDGTTTVSNVHIAKPIIQPINNMGAGAPNGSNVKFDVYNTAGRLKPYIYQDRSALKREIQGEDSIEFKDVKFMTQVRYAMGPLMWSSAVRTEFN